MKKYKEFFSLFFPFPVSIIFKIGYSLFKFLLNFIFFANFFGEKQKEKIILRLC